ncbi:MAG: (2Fe-2S)-binding protein [Deltaproteobacteria bacterium]|nr:(2Fe-2S)-binding protein [Deltaproteobacteria bacterium]
MSRICVDRCVCFARPFDELLAIARRTGANTLEALQEETQFGLACRICNPYVRRMLRTGETVFTEILSDDDEPREKQS